MQNSAVGFGSFVFGKAQYVFKGVRHGVPIFWVIFRFPSDSGYLPSKAAFRPFFATLISLTNLTSAGQAAGVLIIASGGTLIEMILTQAVINIRYSLMAISLSQRLSPIFPPENGLCFLRHNRRDICRGRLPALSHNPRIHGGTYFGVHRRLVSRHGPRRRFGKSYARGHHKRHGHTFIRNVFGNNNTCSPQGA